MRKARPEKGSLKDQLVAQGLATKQQLHNQEKDKEQNIKEMPADSFNIEKAFLPSDTKLAMAEVETIDNFSLKLNKAARFIPENEEDGNKFKFYKARNGEVKFTPKPYFGDLDFAKIADRHSRGIEALNLSVSSCEGTIGGRLIVGLGNESVYDTSMTLHHVYGTPYIPASAVKGVVRSWMITEVFGGIDSGLVPDMEKNYPLVNAEYRAYQDEGFCRIFGCPAKTKKVSFKNDEPDEYETCDTALAKDHQGKVWFFDAFPLSRPEIEVDIMNPHYMPYYSDGEPPVDYYDPKPITFLTVGAGTKFQFFIGIKVEDNLAVGETSSFFKDFNGEPIKVRTGNASGLVKASSDTPLLPVVGAWLKKALEEHGIGAKTAVGYGYMKDF